jgi:hypothetical protein
MEPMGKITIIIPDELEEKVRKLLVDKYDGKIHGKLTELVVAALENYLKREVRK